MAVRALGLASVLGYGLVAAANEVCLKTCFHALVSKLSSALLLLLTQPVICCRTIRL